GRRGEKNLNGRGKKKEKALYSFFKTDKKMQSTRNRHRTPQTTYKDFPDCLGRINCRQYSHASRTLGALQDIDRENAVQKLSPRIIPRAGWSMLPGRTSHFREEINCPRRFCETAGMASKAKKTIAWVHRILKEERDLVIQSRPLEATEFQVENIRWAYVFYESGLSINVLYTLDDKKKRAVGF